MEVFKEDQILLVLTKANGLKILIAIFTIIFSFQVALMPGAMAAGHMGDADNSALSLVKPKTTEVKASTFLTAETKTLSQNTGSNTSQDSSCCAIDCSCNLFLGYAGPPVQAQQSGIKNPFYLVHLAEPPTLVLPAPPRTI